MGAKACPIVNEAVNAINGIAQGDAGKAASNVGLLGLYAVPGSGAGSKVGQASLKSKAAQMTLASASS